MDLLGQVKLARSVGVTAGGGQGSNDDVSGADYLQNDSATQKRHQAAESEDASSDVLVRALALVAQNRMLPKAAWSLCKLMQQKVKPVARLLLEGQPALASAAHAFSNKTVIHLELCGSFEADPLMALASDPAAPATGAADAFDSLFGDVTVITLRRFQGPLVRIPRAVRELRLAECDLSSDLPLLRALVRVTESGPHADAPALVKSMSICRGVEWLPHCVGDLSALTDLWVCRDAERARLPDSVGDLVTLTTLQISGRLCTLPASIGNLYALTKLFIVDCDWLTALPATIGNLKSLSRLHLASCAMTGLPACLSQLEALTKLSIVLLSELKSLPPRLGDLAALTELTISQCDALTALPSSLGSQRSLRKLFLEELPITTLPDSIGGLAALTSLEVHTCRAFSRLPHGVGELRALTRLSLVECGLTALPGALCRLSALVHLDVFSPLLTALPTRLCDLRALTRLNLWRCEDLVALPDSICDLQSLRVLDVGCCRTLKRLPARMGELTALSGLGVHGCAWLLDGAPDAIRAAASNHNPYKKAR